MTCYRFITFFILTALSYGCLTNEQIDQGDLMKKTREMFMNRRYYYALDLLSEITDESLKTREYYLMSGLSYFKLGNFIQAVKSFEKAKPRSLALKIYISYLYLLVGNSDKAKAMADALLHEFGNQADIYILKGNIHLKEKDIRKARQYFVNALELKDDSVKALLGMGNLNLLERNFLKAEEFYLKAVFLSDGDIRPYIALSNYYIAVNRYDDAEDNLKIALDIKPDNINTLFLLENLYIKTGRYRDAVATIKMAAAQYPGSIDLKVRLAKTYLILGRFEEAISTIKDLMADKNGYYYGLVLSGEYYLRKNSMTEALSHFNTALSKNDNSYEVNYYLGLINLIQGNLGLSKQFLEKSVRSYPGFTTSHLLLSLIYLNEKEYTLASEHAKLAIQLDPADASSHIINGASLYLLGKKKEAEYEFDLINIIDPDNPITKFFQYLLYLNDGRDNIKKKRISKIERRYVERLFLELFLSNKYRYKTKDIEGLITSYLKEGKNYLSYLLLGIFFRERGDYNQAEHYLELSIKDYPDCVVSYYYLSEIKILNGDISAAKSLLLKAIDVDRFFIKSYKLLGSLYEKTQNFSEARDIYQKALEYFPEDSFLLNNLAWLMLIHFKDKASSYSYIREAITISPDDIEIKDTMAWWYYHNNSLEQSVSLLKEIIKKDAQNPIFLYHIGMAYLRKGERGFAKEYLQGALELNIDKAYRNEIIGELKDL